MARHTVVTTQLPGPPDRALPSDCSACPSPVHFVISLTLGQPHRGPNGFPGSRTAGGDREVRPCCVTCEVLIHPLIFGLLLVPFFIGWNPSRDSGASDAD